jgi:hypothetical protein
VTKEEQMPGQLPDEKNSETFESVSIWGECGEFSLPGSVWLTVLDVAQRHGWQAAGTDPPDPDYFEFDGRGRDGGYYPPNGQRVAQKDAKNLAQALERALPDIPDGATERETDPFAGWYEKSSSLIQRLGAIRITLEGLIEHCRECGELWLC